MAKRGRKPGICSNPERTKEIVKLLIQGNTQEEVGIKYGITRQRVSQISIQCGLYFHRSQRGQLASRVLLRPFYDQGLNDREIAEKSGYSLGGVREWRWRNNIPAQPPKPLCKNTVRAYELRQEGLSYSKIAQAMGVDVMTVYRAVWRYEKRLRASKTLPDTGLG